MNKKLQYVDGRLWDNQVGKLTFNEANVEILGIGIIGVDKKKGVVIYRRVHVITALHVVYSSVHGQPRICEQNIQ